MKLLALQFRTLLNTRIFLCVGIARIVCLTAVSVKFYRKHLNRFSTIDKIRRIIVAENGTHEELMKENGLYHRLVDLQTASANWKLSV